MIDIQVVEAVDEEIRAFQKREWEPADMEHYGIIGDWTETHKALKAFENNELVGILEIECKAGVIHIESVLVRHDKYQQGIGTALMKRAEEIAREYKIHKLYLDTGKNWAARKLYDKLGYSVVADLPNHYLHHDYVIYEKILE